MNREDAKKKIIFATIEEFNSKGLKFTMDDIAMRTGMSKKTLYNLFGDKERLLDITIDYCFELVKTEEKIIVDDKEMDIIEKVKKLMFFVPEKYKYISYEMIQLLENKYPQLYQKIYNNIEAEWVYIDRILNVAIKQGRVRKVSIPVIRAALEGGVVKILNTPLLVDEEKNYDAALTELVGILVGGIRMN